MLSLPGIIQVAQINPYNVRQNGEANMQYTYTCHRTNYFIYRCLSLGFGFIFFLFSFSLLVFYFLCISTARSLDKFNHPLPFVPHVNKIEHIYHIKYYTFFPSSRTQMIRFPFGQEIEKIAWKSNDPI